MSVYFPIFLSSKFFTIVYLYKFSEKFLEAPKTRKKNFLHTIYKLTY